VVFFGISKVLRDLKIYTAHRWHIRAIANSKKERIGSIENKTKG